MQLLNYCIIAVIVFLIILVLFIFFKRNYTAEAVEAVNPYGIQYLTNGVKETFQGLLKMRIEELNLNQYEAEKRIRNKSKLRKSIRLCSCGDLGAKSYVLDYIVELLQKKFEINEQTVDLAIPFGNEKKLTTTDKFDILLYQYKKEHGYHGLEKMIEENALDGLKRGEDGELYYEIAAEDIDLVYLLHQGRLSYLDKLDILAQRIYQNYLGHGVVDEIRDMKIDGVSGGVSGLPVDLYNYSEDLKRKESKKVVFSYDSIWIFFRGKLIRLSFLGFGTQRELERICKNIYRHNSPGQLSEEKGHIENDMKDGSRIVVVRPPFSDSWAFLVRKHDSYIEKINLMELITDRENGIAVNIMKCLVKGCQVLAITGEQGSGKTTLLRGLIRYINPTYSLRIQELIFELWLRRLYPDRNILTFKELPNISGQEGLDLQKKTDGAVNILGEVATATVANWVIQMAQAASLFTMFTHHAKRTEDLISWMRNALLKEGGFNNEQAAEEQVVRVINFDIHMGKTVEGHRYIERITEIVPCQGRELYKLKDILIYRDGSYMLVDKISSNAKNQIFRFLTETEKKEFSVFFEREKGMP